MAYSKIIVDSLSLKCPACGKGKIFKSYLKLKPADKCDSCSLDLTQYNVGDSPAYFSIFTVGVFIPVLAVTAESLYVLPLWAHALLWLPLTFLFCYLTLIYIRSIFIYIEHNYKNPNDEK